MATDFVFSPDNLRTGSLNFVFGGTTLFVIRGGSDFITSIVVDLNSTLESGCFYITTNNSLMKINAETLTVDDFYSIDVAGRYRESLNSEGVQDFNIL